MTIFVVEIAGRGIVAFNEVSATDAEAFAKSAAFGADLMELDSDGRPLWNGVDELFVREAFPEEQARWQASRTRAVTDGDVDDDDTEMWVLYLIPVVDRTE